MQLVHVPFHDRNITCVFDTRTSAYHIPFRPLCEELGLKPDGQLQRLRRNHWATTFVINVVAADGKEREMVTIDRKTFAMWLATLVSSRIKDENAKEAIEAYQLEAVDVLDQHFNHVQASAPVVSAPAIKPTSSTLDLIGMADLLASSFRKHYELEQSVVVVQTEQAQLRAELEATRSELAQAKADSARAVRTVTSESGWFTLVTWAEQHGIFLAPPKDGIEGKVVTGMCRDRGIEPGKWKGPRYSVGTYPEHILYLWLDNYRSRGTDLRVASPA